MIPPQYKKQLIANYGPRAQALECLAPLRLNDPLSSWCLYPFAMDPTETEVDCLFYRKDLGPQIINLQIIDLYIICNLHGESPVVDDEYRPTPVKELLKRYDPSRN